MLYFHPNRMMSAPLRRKYERMKWCAKHARYYWPIDRCSECEREKKKAGSQ
jgi:hypothetical protein